ncbi:FAD-dependent monooxygenase [Amycolatopsis sp. ATCC 39116]|uniref:FAD-dependent monooxygenase n=1 Tax=Amycolatopsis sp. (strain ATCC 39116 / 75iv2) TaxID=385957 RepID=UPI0002628A5E|nr:FAD-dependent monooxygenase [Amycolatopsis sp. ATCC 39116]
MTKNIVIAGAGPTGLWLAAELRLAGAEVTVLEQRTERDPHSKALTIHPRTIEVLASRGVEQPFLAEGIPIPQGHFAVLDDRLDFALLDTDFPITLALLQARTEELLEDHARDRGADIRRGHRVTGLTEHPGEVRVTVDGPDGGYTIAAAYVVGCDGTRSTVRAAAGIDFPGTSASVYGWLGDVVLTDPPSAGSYSRATADGLLLAVPLPGGLHRLVGHSPDDIRADRPGELTLDELRAKVTAIAGRDFGMHSPAWLSRFSNASRQATRYRRGRVLLAGDAAHMHMPAGGVGLNVGLQDAMNLGWKLGAVVRGEAPDDLLDTYHDERHPVGAELLEHTQAQTALMTAFSPDGRRLRSLLSTLIAEQPAFAKALAERLSGLSVRYPGAHPLTGTRAPNLKFGDTTLFRLLHAGRPVLLDFREEPGPAAPGAIVHHGRPLDDRPDWAALDTALIRPDGHVAEVTPSGEPDQHR